MTDDALSSPRLRLEPLAAVHAAELAGLLDLRVLAWVDEPGDIEGQRTRFARMAEGPPEGSGQAWVNFAVRRRADGRAIGRVEATVHDGLAEVACVFDPATWGQGCASEAAAWLLDHCARVQGVERFFATAHPDNARSLALCQRLGFRPAETWPPLLSYDEGDVVMMRDV